MNYREKKDATVQYKSEYVKGLNNVIVARQKECEKERFEYTKDIFENQEKYRADFIKMLGWPLGTEEMTKTPKLVSEEKLSSEDGYTVYRLRFEILDGLLMTGLFFKMNGDEKRPFLLVPHAGYGTPEFISGVYGGTGNDHDMVQRLLKYNVNVFVPQLALWNEGTYGVGINRTGLDARLKRVGSSIAAVEICGLINILNYFEGQAYTGNIGMCGLSYGGFFTLFTTAIDKRVKSAVSCSFFNSRDAYPWCDWTWQNAAKLFDDAEIACLVYPRPICIEFGHYDELFDYEYTLRSYERIKTMCAGAGVGTNWLTFHDFDGMHEFCWDEEPLEKLVSDLK